MRKDVQLTVGDFEMVEQLLALLGVERDDDDDVVGLTCVVRYEAAGGRSDQVFVLSADDRPRADVLWCAGEALRREWVGERRRD